MTKKYEINVSSEYCLPEPLEPNWRVIMICLGLYLLSLFCALLQGYAVRIRGLIAGFFFPDREKERLLHLRDKIMRRRLADSIVFGSKSSWSSRGSGGSGGLGSGGGKARPYPQQQDDRMDYHKIISPPGEGAHFLKGRPGKSGGAMGARRSLLSSFRLKKRNHNRERPCNNESENSLESSASNKMSRESSAKTFQTNVSDDYVDGFHPVEETDHKGFRNLRKMVAKEDNDLKKKANRGPALDEANHAKRLAGRDITRGLSKSGSNHSKDSGSGASPPGKNEIG